jgi:RNA polymerase sigma-70 factor (ECF subfamily)
MDRRLKRRFGASDIVQEAFVEADRRLAAYARDRPMSFYIWLRTLTLQKLYDAVKFHRAKCRDADQEISLDLLPKSTSRAFAVQLAGTLTTPGQAAEQREFATAIAEAMQRLSPEHRAVLLLRHWEGLSNQEIAEALDLSKSAASKRYIAALQRLRAELDKASGQSRQGE